jgi:mRNA interferase RelE/StbE
MVEYQIKVSATAERQLRKLQPADRNRLIVVIQKLADNPRPKGCRKLRGYDDVYRVREGAFRIIYSIEDDCLLVLLLKIGHRKDVYRGYS